MLVSFKSPTSNMYIKIYDIPMKFACKLIHGGPVRLWNIPVTV